MISSQFAARQIVRLAILPNAPGDTDAVEFAFRESARNESHADRMTAWMLRNLRFFPIPREVYDAGSQTLHDDDLLRPDHKCSACGGTGYAQAWVLDTHNEAPGGGLYKTCDLIMDPSAAREIAVKVDGKRQMVYPGVVRCRECGYGRALAIADQQARDAA